MKCSRRRFLTATPPLVLFSTGCLSIGETDEDQSSTIKLEVVITGPDGEETLFTQSDIDSVGEISEHRQGGYMLPVSLSPDGTDNATSVFLNVGAADAPEESSISYEIHGEPDIQRSFQISPQLADAIATGEWGGDFVLQFNDTEHAETIRNNLMTD